MQRGRFRQPRLGAAKRWWRSAPRFRKELPRGTPLRLPHSLLEGYGRGSPAQVVYAHCFHGTPESAVLRCGGACSDGTKSLLFGLNRINPPAAVIKSLFLRSKSLQSREDSPCINLPGSKLMKPGNCLRRTRRDVAVVVAYGRILPAEFLRAPRRGCINVHFSLLPKYRAQRP